MGARGWLRNLSKRRIQYNDRRRLSFTMAKQSNKRSAKRQEQIDAKSVKAKEKIETYEDAAVKATLLTKPQLTTIILMALGISRLLQLHRSIVTNDDTNDNTAALESCVGYLGSDACTDPLVQTVLKLKAATGVQASFSMGMAAIFAWKQPAQLVKLTITWMFSPLMAILVVLWIGRDVSVDDSLWKRLVLMLLALLTISFPESYQELPFFSKRKTIPQKSIHSLVCMTTAILLLKQAYDFGKSPLETILHNVSEGIPNAAKLVLYFVAVDYLTMAGQYLYAWRYLSEDWQRVFLVNQSLVHAVAYLVQWPSLEAELKDYELLRAISLAFALMGPLLWICPSLTVKPKVE